MSLPKERKVWQFSNASVIYTCEEDFNNKIHYKLYVQVIDEYRYQREWSLQYRFEPGNSSNYYWESHAYRHPGRHEIQKVTNAKAKKLMERFLYLLDNYPSLLFNDRSESRARHEGFVHFNEILLDGAEPSSKLLS